MSTKSSNSSKWTHPDELIKLERLKQRKKQLAARVQNNNNNTNRIININENDKSKLLEAKIAQKRKNPFAKSTDDTKKQRTIAHLPHEDDSLLDFINATSTNKQQEIFVRETPRRSPAAKLEFKPFDAKAFAKLLHGDSAVANDDDEAPEQQNYTKHLPMDWCLKTRARIFCESELPTTTLKTSQMASGLTSFVRCIDTKNSESSLDISEAARFNQATYYWQHPYLPWLTLFPRNSKNNIGLTIDESERKILSDEWIFSFRGLFQLLRARQCPYFYVCANNFTALFRAAGIAGRVEMHALITPSTRGIRNALRQEGIEYTMPLKTDFGLNKSGDDVNNLNVSTLEDHNTTQNVESKLVEATTTVNEDDDEDEEGWLESLGVDEKLIRKIQIAHSRKLHAAEMSDDFSDNSLLLIEGVECQGFFSYLLNTKSSISSVGRLAGVPPTLLAPVAFPKATMQNLCVRSSKVHLDGIDYNSIDMRGVVLPTCLPYICQLLNETKKMYSVTLGSHTHTLAFSKATRKLLETQHQTNNEVTSNLTGTTKQTDTAGQVFGRENLSDCGLLPEIVEAMCRTEANAVTLLERVCYNKDEGYAWN